MNEQDFTPATADEQPPETAAEDPAMDDFELPGDEGDVTDLPESGMGPKP